jgi:hypothetical protein
MAERNLSELADLHWKLELKIQAAKEILKELESEQDKISLEAIERSKEEKNPVCRGKLASGEVKPRELYSFSNFEAFCAFVKKTGNWQLFQRRIGSEAYRELIDARVKVPGVKSITQYVFKTKKLKK